MNIKRKSCLSCMKLPYDLKKLSIAQCKSLCREIRVILIKTVSENGGHLASNLGTVELTLALHRVFDSPSDKIILSSKFGHFFTCQHSPIFSKI